MSTFGIPIISRILLGKRNISFARGTWIASACACSMCVSVLLMLFFSCIVVLMSEYFTPGESGRAQGPPYERGGHVQWIPPAVKWFVTTQHRGHFYAILPYRVKHNGPEERERVSK